MQPSKTIANMPLASPGYFRALPVNTGRLGRFKKLVILLSVFSVITGAQLALNSPWQKVFYAGVASFAAMGWLLRVRVPANRLAGPAIIVLTILILAAMGTTLTHRWIHPVLVYGAVAAGYFAAIRTVCYVGNPNAFIKLFVLAIAFSSIMIMSACVLLTPIRFRAFQGIFNNPNSMGWFCSSLGSLLLGVFVYSKTTWTRWQATTLACLFVATLLFMFISTSRASMAALSTAIGVYGLVFFHSFILQSPTRRKRLFQILVFVAVIAVIAYFFGLFDRVIEKFEVTSERGDISQGRLTMWEIHLENWQWFGNDSVYLSFVKTHSTYVNQISRYGMAPAVAFISFLLVMWFTAYIYTLRGRYQTAPILLAVVSTFLAHAFFETGTQTPGLWMSIILYCCLMDEVKRGGEEDSSKSRYMVPSGMADYGVVAHPGYPAPGALPQQNNVRGNS